jgi:hypothetical protein
MIIVEVSVLMFPFPIVYLLINVATPYLATVRAPSAHFSASLPLCLSKKEDPNCVIA